MKPLSGPLLELARAHGVQPSFFTMTGERQHARPEALIAVLGALGVPATTDREIRDSLREHASTLWTEPLEPVITAWDGSPTKVRLHFPVQAAAKPIHARVWMENDDRPQALKAGMHRKLAEVQTGGKKLVASELTLPPLPFGFHELELELGGQRFTSLIISAPVRSYSRGNRRDWGIFLPMYAAGSKSNWGTGNFSDWRQLCDWTASHGGSIAGTLPLLAAFLDHPKCDPSPYSPASRLFWNEFYLDVTAIPEFARSMNAQRLVNSSMFCNHVRRFQRAPLVDYEKEWQMRRRVLELLADDFFAHSDDRHHAFEAYLKRRPEAEDYAAFRAVCDRTGKSWHNWPQRLRAGELSGRDFDHRTKRFHLYIQWQTQQQIEALIQHCRSAGVQFYLDLPLGVHPDGYDVWRERGSFAMAANAGAPPDSFFTLGQNWGFAPLHPQRIRRQRYRYVLDYLRFQMRHTGLLRIDHVMCLHRLYWIAQGCDPKDGVYVSYPADELYAILSLESHRNQTVLVGENLGTVPPEVDAGMEKHRLRGMFVVQYQQRADPKAALDQPQRRTVASLNTHDIPAFAAHWKGLEIVDHARLGLVSKSEVKLKRAERKKLNGALISFLKSQGVLTKNAQLEAVLPALLEWLSRSPAEIVLVNLEDLWLERLPQNVPGTYRERPNWQRKAKLFLHQIFADKAIAETLRRVAKHRPRNKQKRAA